MNQEMQNYQDLKEIEKVETDLEKLTAIIEEKLQLLNCEIAKIKQHLARIDKELKK